jgi:transposase-like protein
MEILTTLNSYSAISILNPILTQFSNDYTIEYGTFYSKIPPNCPRCGHKMNHNGSNTLSKKNVAQLKVGKYKCPKCNLNIQESHGPENALE